MYMYVYCTTAGSEWTAEKRWCGEWSYILHIHSIYTIYAEIFVVLRFLWVLSTTKNRPMKFLLLQIIRALSPPIVPRCCHTCAKKWEDGSLTLYVTRRWTTWPLRPALFDSTTVIHCHELSLALSHKPAFLQQQLPICSCKRGIHTRIPFFWTQQPSFHCANCQGGKIFMAANFRGWLQPQTFNPTKYFTHENFFIYAGTYTLLNTSVDVCASWSTDMLSTRTSLLVSFHWVRKTSSTGRMVTLL